MTKRKQGIVKKEYSQLQETKYDSQILSFFRNGLVGIEKEE